MSYFIHKMFLLYCFTTPKLCPTLCNPHNKKIAVLGQKYCENVKIVFHMNEFTSKCLDDFDLRFIYS